MDVFYNVYIISKNSNSDSGICFVFGYPMCDRHQNDHSEYPAVGQIFDNSWNHVVERTISLFVTHS